MSRTTECMCWLDSEDIYAIGKYYTEKYGWTYSDDELELLSEYYAESENGDYVYEFNIKLIFEDNHCEIMDNVIDEYEDNSDVLKYICSNGKIVYEFLK